MTDLSHARIAVLVPCYNEATTIAAIVRDFRAVLPAARIHVFDNNSTDDTARVARAAGATVHHVPAQGKGSVVRRMFADVEADAYVMVDGDDTYDASAAPRMVEKLLAEGIDMLVGSRVTQEEAAYRFGHRFGNRLLTGCVSALFGRTFSDILSGYRVFSRRYVKSFAAHSTGFEIETELTVHALGLRMPVAEVQTEYKSRPEGSFSKLSTYRDGARILLTILRLFKSERPLAFYSLGFLVCALASFGLAVPLVMTWLATGLVPRLPTAVLCTALMLFGMILLACGIILDAVTKSRIEQKRFAYLSVPMAATAVPAAPRHSAAA
ncbi:glycosyltransferase involved in cell wall biosynthesis [Pseudoduganella lurida]|uniref:Glycosyltransferase involved in cell wall biosynthesis n=1 Tax=Pseudoduganella lurida TaxID=1036180 RepID=A0A562QXR8_9BURK|nr:glycosyltransferase family 2 protein [Pseudoduganella lurida]TWI60926.1 glycosyltransferase involved in cell wall biosynthesis [Pseudoduganella lurida]